MKSILFMMLLVVHSITGKAQTDLYQFRELARQHYPKLEQAELMTKIAALKNQNTQSNYLPQVELKGQATYQSEVIEFDLPIPGFEFEPVSRDQYKIYLDLKQNIWDGGLTKTKKELEMAALETDLQKLKIEIQQVFQMVDAYYFGILMVEKSSSVLSAQQSVLSGQLNKLEQAINYGAARGKEKLQLEMENLLIEQKILELQSRKKSFVAMLEVLTGQPINNGVQMSIPDSVQVQTVQLRPELKYFELQMQQINHANVLLKSSRNPMFFGFGQAGYGKPGFNMLKNEFSPYYIFGVGLNWKLTDWKQTSHSLEINAHNRALIGTIQNDFLQKQQIQMVEANEKINYLKALIKTDENLVEGRQSIAQSASAELQNGTINSTNYLIDLNAETVARINLEMHKIQLIQAIFNYNSLLGY